MHIVFVTKEFSTKDHVAYGLASYTANMARMFSDYGHKVTVIAANTKEISMTPDCKMELINLYVPMKKWKQMNYLAGFLSHFMKDNQDEIRRAIMQLYKGRQVRHWVKTVNKKDKIDMIHYCNLDSLSRLHPKKIPYVVRISGFGNMIRGEGNTPGGSIEFQDNPLSVKDKLEDRILKRAKNIIVPSNFLSQIAKKNLNISATVIESPYCKRDFPVNSEYYEKHLSGKRYILNYGTLSYPKGIHVIAGLAKELLKHHRDLYIVLVGRSQKLEDKTLHTHKAHELVMAKAEEYADRVIYAGELTQKELFPIIKKAELCILPSRIENLSNACIEAMAMGKIVVATNGASYEQLIEDRVNGYLCERDNPDSFLQGIEEANALSDEQKNEMSQKAMKTVERLRPENIYKQYLEYYQKVMREW